MTRKSSQNRRVQGNGKPNGFEAFHGAFAAKDPKRRACWRRSFLLHLRRFEPLCWFRRLFPVFEFFVAGPKRMARVQRTSYRRRLQGEILCDRALMAGDLDITFDGDGKVTTDLVFGENLNDRARSVAIQSDGKIVVAGSSFGSGIHDFALARYNSNGSLDTTFDGDGKVTTDFGGGDSASSVAIQSDGKIVVAGYSFNGRNVDFALARYNSNGSLDPAFGSNGKVTTDFGSDDTASSVTIQSDGKIVVAGSSRKTGNSPDDFALARYNSNGILDTTFDGDGKVTTDFGSDDTASSLAIQSDGKIVVAGQSLGSIQYDFALARYNSNGSLDTTFGSDGKVTTDFSGDFDGAYSVAIQSDGKIVVAGGSTNSSVHNFALARYDSNGGLDTTFDGDGKVTTDFGGDDEGAFSVAIQSDGKIVVAGHSGNIDSSDFALSRYDSNGGLDTTFDGDGKVTTDFGTGFDRAYGVAIQSDGKIVVAGDTNGNSSTDFALSRYNVNEAPTDITLSPTSIAENAPANTTVGTLSTIDPDSGDTFTYTLVTGSGDTDNDSFNISGNSLRATSTFNFETKSSYTVRVRSTDQAGLFTEKTFAVSVTNVNEVPTDIALSSTSIPENAGANAVVGTLTTTDVDAGNTFTYTLVAGTGDTDNGAFNISDSNLRATSSFDFETKSSYTIRIRSTDQGGLFTEKTFTITVIDINESPTNISLSSNTIAENSEANTPVGTLSTSDPDAGDTFTYSLVTGTDDTDNGAFNISGKSLRATNSFNFEAKSIYTVRVRSTDQGGLFTEKAFTISVTNVNEVPTDIALSSSTIAENAGANAVVGTLSTTDPDGGNTFAYSLVTGAGDADNGSFNISGNSLQATSNFDFETKSSYTIRVRSTDQGGLFTEKTFTSTVTNVNETPTDIGLSSSSIAENAGANTPVGTLSTTDPDAGNTFTYALVTGSGDTDNASFNISGNSLQATSNFDFETKSSYTIRIRSTDQNGLFVENAFAIQVVNANEPPTDIGLSWNILAENAGFDTTVGTFSTTDVDAGNTFAYSLVTGAGDADNASFRVLGSALVAISNFDFETKSSYSIRVRSTDQGGLFVEKTFVITVIDVNEAPTDISLSSSTIAENAAANTPVGTMSTADPDAGNSFTYTLVAGSGDADNAAFNIAGSILRATNTLNFEAKSSYTVRVRTTDQGGLFVEKAFAIQVVNVNETPTDISLTSTTIAENSVPNAMVGTLSTADVDAGNTFVYSLVAGSGDTDNAAFNVSGSTLRATSSFDFETRSDYTVRVRSTDHGGLFVEKVFAISILNVNDAPVAVADSYWVSVSTPQMLNVLANDSDIDSAIDPTSIEIVQPPSHGTATPLPDGTVRYTPNAGYRGDESFTYRVRDSLGLFSNEATVQLRVNSAPNTNADSLVVRETITTVLDVLRNDSDPDGSLDPATLVIDSSSDMADVVVQSDGTIRFTPRVGFLGTTQFRYVVSDNEGRPSVPTDVTVLVVVSIYQNPRNRFDVDDDRTVSPLDVLVLINLLNSQAPSLPVDGLPGPPPYVDVNGDNRVDPLDVLEVINYINSGGNGEGEGSATCTFDDVFASDDWQEELRKTNRLRLIKF
jgi:uncharacterized delta-60 repeat protein